MASVLRILFCVFLPLGLTQKVTITQDSQLLIEKVGSEVALKCEQLTTDHDNMYWYYHSRGQGLKLIASMLRKNEPTYEEGYKVGYKMDRTHADKHSSLSIESLTQKHQGVYFCASSDAR
ncbi:unnamed protein product [Ranitomeya imitator]|uniref:Ig-like domain-containing protein n=1 Tax=Ranitomeya imitator TaxID=111125 RepID=A0ABN9LX42_9NEOB|nr:unnamed protein product [Ranitomeya imitator]